MVNRELKNTIEHIRVLSHYLGKNLIITNFTFQLKHRLDVQAPPLSKSYNSTGRLFQIEIHFKL